METLPDDSIAITLGRPRGHGMGAAYYPTAREAAEDTLRGIPREATVGVGGSITIREMGLPEALRQRGQTVHDHRQDESRQARHAIGRHQQQSDCFLTSTNALTVNGELVNVDASVNRVSAMVFGPSRVIAVTGVNKLVPNVTAALARVKTVAAPLNCQRRGNRTPCARDLVCRDCDSPHRLLPGHDHHRTQAVWPGPDGRFHRRRSTGLLKRHPVAAATRPMCVFRCNFRRG